MSGGKETNCNNSEYLSHSAYFVIIDEINELVLTLLLSASLSRRLSSFSQILPRLFSKFAAKPEVGGTGLGLSIVKSIIEAHGGRVWAENNADGKGARFSVILRIANQSIKIKKSNSIKDYGRV